MANHEGRLLPGRASGLSGSGALPPGLLAALADRSTSGLAAVSADGTVIHANATWMALTMAAGPVEGESLDAPGVLPVSLRPEVMAAVTLARAGAVFDDVIGHASGDQTRRWRLRATTLCPETCDQPVPVHTPRPVVLLTLDPCSGFAGLGRSQADDGDPVTGLPGRRRLHTAIESALEVGRRSSRVVAVMFIDLDGFKAINDGLGHASGDRLLHAVARRITGAVRGGRVWRYGGDEFVVLLDDLVDPRVAWSAADRVLANVARPVSVGNHEITPSCSIGVALADAHVTSGAELVSRADDAMYLAKGRGGGRVERFDRELAHRRKRVRSFEKDLGVALTRGEIDVHYQPEFDLVRGDIVGAEALIRWNHRDHGLLDAADFLPVALDLGMGADLATFVENRVCEDVTTWEELDIELDLRINLSPVQIERSIIDRMLGVVDSFQLDAATLIFEIREPDNPTPEWANLLTRLQRSGARVALDHFGTGSLSVTQLCSLDVDSVKIDGDFLAELERGDGSGAESVLAALIQLADALDLDVSADRIETSSQRDALIENGCRRGQGHHFASPMSMEGLVTLVQVDTEMVERAQPRLVSTSASSSASSLAVVGPSGSVAFAFAG